MIKNVNWRTRMKQLLLYKNNTCYYCNVILTHKESNNSFLTLEHLKSKMYYEKGKSTCSNVVLACKWCNNARGRLEQKLLIKIPPDIFKNYISTINRCFSNKTEEIVKSFMGFILTNPQFIKLLDANLEYKMPKLLQFKYDLQGLIKGAAKFVSY